jgi:Porin PorA
VRRTVGMVLIGMGAFFLTLAPLIRYYVGHQVLAAPTNVYQQVTLKADNASYLDEGKLKMRNGATLVATVTTRGDVRAATGKLAVWDYFVSIQDQATGQSVQVQSQRAAFDRRTAMLVNCCGASVNGDTSVHQSGVGLFWPIGVQKKTYPYFDPATMRTWPMYYNGEAKIHGVTTYRFVQTIPATKTDTVKGLPPSLLGFKKKPGAHFPGLDTKTGSLTADEYYASVVTVWVDPRTGAPVNQEEALKTTLRTRDGVDRLTVANLDLKMTDASQKDLVKLTNDNATVVALAKTTGPLIALVVGLVALIAGFVLVATGRRRGDDADPPAAADPGPPATAAETPAPADSTRTAEIPRSSPGPSNPPPANPGPSGRAPSGRAPSDKDNPPRSARHAAD